MKIVNTKKLFNVYLLSGYIHTFAKPFAFNYMGNSSMMTHNYTNDQIDKIGNTIRFLTSDASLTRTKILKIIYLLEEASIKRFGVPFFNIPFEVWQFGPVPRPIFQNLSFMFQDYADLLITDSAKGEIHLISKKGEFNDDEFSDNDIELLTEIKRIYSKKPSDELVAITHKEGSPWHIAAVENDLLEGFDNGSIKFTDHYIDLVSVIESPILKEIYLDYLDCHGNPNT